MSKRNRTILRKDLDELPLEMMCTEALAGDGVGARRATIMAGGIDCLVIFVVGMAGDAPLVDAWSETVDQYHAQQQQKGGTNGQSQV